MNILDVESGIICHQVNCRGKMGTGIALAIRKKWPEVYARYMKDFHAGKLRLGHFSITNVSYGLFVANLAAQFDYGRVGKFRL